MQIVTIAKAVLAAAMCLALTMVGGARCVSQEGRDGGLRMDLTLDDQFSLHEPMVAVLRIQNDSSQAAQLDLGLNHRGALVFTFSQPDGKQIVRHLPEDFDGFGESGEVTLKPGDSYHEELVLNDWQEFDQPGTYEFQLAFAPSSQPGPWRASTLRTAGRFRVTPTDPVRLGTACARLAALALGKNVTAAWNAAHGLSHATDQVCLPSMLQALAGCFACRADILLGLARLGTPEAARGVAGAWNMLDEHSRKSAMLDFSQVGKAALLDTALRAVKPSALCGTTYAATSARVATVGADGLVRALAPGDEQRTG
jgi:hypothetical protein